MLKTLFDNTRVVIRKYKKILIIHSVIFLILSSAVVWVFHDYEIYKNKTILRVTEIENRQYVQNITGKIMNGEYKGEVAKAENGYSESGAFDEKYEVGDELFVELNANSGGDLNCSIVDMKRDKYLAVIVAILIWGLLIVAGKRGLFAIISVSVNIVLLTFALELYSKGYNILNIFNCLVIAYTIICLLFISGFSIKTFSAIVSILGSLIITMVIFRVSYHYSNGVEFFLMDYLISPDDLYELFMSEILIGGLGAIMDVAITISSAIFELLGKNSSISLKSLFISGRQIGYDIMGTMISVLLFTFVCGSIPFIVLQLKNGYNLVNIVSVHLPFEIYRFLAGGIGILLSIPISIGASVLFGRKFRGIRHD